MRERTADNVQKTDRFLRGCRKGGVNMRLIDADALIEKTKERCRYWGMQQYYMNAVRIIEFIKYAPTVEAEPVVHGRWFGNLCSVCNKLWDEDMHYHADDFGYFDPMPNYCPNCGADMRGRK